MGKGKRPRLGTREVLRILLDLGWVCIDQTGSHMKLKHPTLSGAVTVKDNVKTFGQRLIMSMQKQAGIDFSDFIKSKKEKKSERKN